MEVNDEKPETGLSVINACFADVTLYKTENKEGFCIYAAAMATPFTAGTKNYLLAFVPEHLSILSSGKLRELQWENVQTRVLTNGYRDAAGKLMAQQKWTPPRGLSIMFNVASRDEG